MTRAIAKRTQRDMRTALGVRSRPMTRARPPCSAFWMAAYLACLLLVASFIFFEVLDVDGSDFRVPLPHELTIKLTEPPQDIRRHYLQPTILPVIAPPAEVETRLETHGPVEQQAALPDLASALVRSRDSRSTLARASLDDAAPVA
jgi:hypothetical protein